MSKKLLLADDSVVIQKLVGLSFANENIEIVSTDNGDDAVIVAREILPDIILADVVMPGKSGYEVCEAVKQDPSLAHIPVLLLTGTFEAFDETRAQSAGANGQITKPFEAQALVTRVTEVMNAPPVEVALPPVAAPVLPPATASADRLGALGASPLSALDTDTDNQNDPIALAGDSLAIGSDPLALGRDPLALDDDPLSPPSLDDDLSINPASPSDVTRAIGFDETGLDMTPELSANFGLEEPGQQTVSALFEDSPEAGGPDLAAPFDASTDSPSDSPSASHSGSDFAPLSGQDAGYDVDPNAETVFGRRANDAVPGTQEADRPATPPIPPALPPALPPTAPSPQGNDDALIEVGASEARPVSPWNETPRDEGAPSFLPAEDDINATTSPSYAMPGEPTEDPSTSVSAPQSFSQFDDLTVHAPSADIDRDSNRTEAPASARFGGPEGSDVTDLSGLDASEATVVADLDQSLAIGTGNDTSSVKANSGLDLGPASMNPDDLDFAFDVSEQVSAENAADTAGDSYSTLLDISESQILGGATERTDEGAAGHAGATPADTIVAGYDVSSSDLATSGVAGAVATPPPVIPTPEPLYEIPELPRTYPRESAATGSGDVEAPRANDANLFAGLNTGSALEDIPPVADFEVGSALDSNEDLLVAQTFDEDASEDSDGDAGDDSSVAQALAIGGVSTLSGLAMLSGSEDAHSTSDSDADEAELEPLTAADDADDFVVGIVHEESTASRSVPDISPAMEQQIQETLEKVAWEAFSDLSESIVKQVMGRVEQIAWEVIPEMAETLVREEIRKMKGDDD